MTPVVTKIFEDLEEYRDFVRLQYPQIPLNEADLYNYRSPHWQKFERQRAKKAKQNKSA
jgi:hypothetical protein